MRFLLRALAFCLICTCLIAHKEPAQTSVKLVSHKGRVIPFKIRSQKLEWVNGKLNLAILSTDNKLLQLNNMSDRLIKDTIFRNDKVTFLLIDSNRTFIQNNRILPLLEVECSQPVKGQPVHIRAHGRIYYNKIWYTTTLSYYGSLPEKRANTTYTK